MRALALLAVAASILPSDAEACSISMEPDAHVFRPTSGKPGGHRPFISLWQVTKPVSVTQVAASCIADTICKGAAVAVERVGTFMRPKTALPDGARIQITHANKLLADYTVVNAPAKSLPAWDGIEWVSAKQEKEGLCSPAGPVVRLRVKPTSADLTTATLLVYLTKPDPKRPLAGLATMFTIESGREIEIGNGFGNQKLLAGVPKLLYVMLADGDGNVGPVIKLP